MDEKYFDDKDSSILHCIGGLITFSTILPIKIYSSIEAMARVTWLWPFINGLIGLIGVGIVYLLSNTLHFSNLFVAVFVYGFFLVINGFNHLDGLLDFGDGLMVHGDPEKKLSVMKDVSLGAGAVGLMFIVGTLSVASFEMVLSYGLIWGILVSEMSAKIGLTSCCISSKPASKGIGAYFVKSMNLLNYVISLIIALIIAFLLCDIVGVMGVLGGVFGGAFVALLGKKHLGVANGDVLGSSNELGRLFSLIFMLIALVLL